MAQINFYLEKRRDKASGFLITKSVPIFLFYSLGNKQRLQYYTGQRVDRNQWDEKHMRVKGNSHLAAAINEHLQNLRSVIEKAHIQARVNEVPVSVDYFKAILAGKEQNQSPVSKNFKESRDEYLEELILSRKGGTINSIRTSLNNFGDFEKAKKIALTFENITIDFYNQFLSWCFNERGYKNNYTGKLIKDLKSFLNWATDKGYNSNLDFRKKAFRKLKEEPEIVFLKHDELMHLFTLKITVPAMSRVRDVFCFGCFTGLRYSDIKNLRHENVHEDMIIYRVIKTEAANTIPLNKYSREILDRYKDLEEFCLPVISEQKTNQYLKELFAFAGLDRKIQIVHYQGAKRISESYPLHEIVTFHMSKKTFMTNFLAKGGSLHTAMAITGNKSFQTAKRYFTVVDTLKQEEMKKVFG